MHLIYPLTFAAVLFAVGVYGVLARRNAILVLASIELMLGAVSLNLVTFDIWQADALHSGQVLALFVIVIAAAETGVGLAIVLLVFRTQGLVAIDRVRELAEGEGPPAGSGAGAASSGPAPVGPAPTGPCPAGSGDADSPAGSAAPGGVGRAASTRGDPAR